MKKKLFICPKCGSADSKVPRMAENILFSGTDIKKCGRCGYEGIFLEVDADKLEEVQKKIKYKK